MTGLESRISQFSNGAYRGYEVRLQIHRTAEYEPLPLRNAREVYGFMQELRNEQSEHMYELLMDTKHRLTGVYLVGKGTLDSCPGHPAEIYRAALMANSPAFLLVHNHPSGVPEPSQDDRHLLRRIVQGAEIIGLDVLDSIIIGSGSYFSFREAGLL